MPNRRTDRLRRVIPWAPVRAWGRALLMSGARCQSLGIKGGSQSLGVRGGSQSLWCRSRSQSLGVMGWSQSLWCRSQSLWYSCDFSVSPWSKSFFFPFLGDFYSTWGPVGTGAQTWTWTRAWQLHSKKFFFFLSTLLSLEVLMGQKIEQTARRSTVSGTISGLRLVNCLPGWRAWGGLERQLSTTGCCCLVTTYNHLIT